MKMIRECCWMGGALVVLWTASVSAVLAQDTRGLLAGHGNVTPDGIGPVPMGYRPFATEMPGAANILSHGQPVIPMMEGWWRRPDGTKAISFEYLNMNYAETLHIPIGPDNYIEPAEFNGSQPTHFMPASGSRRRHRHQAVFSVVVPADYEGDVVWRLRVRGEYYSVPGRTRVEAYVLDDLSGLTSAPVAHTLRFPDGAEGRGRIGPFTGPLTVAVGDPLSLEVWVDPNPDPSARADDGEAPMVPSGSIVTWYHHQGAGEVAFSDRETVLEGPSARDVRTTATFSAPGEYMIRVTAVEDLASMVQRCCYTNGYVSVTVTP